jgi:hypothetical protein
LQLSKLNKTVYERNFKNYVDQMTQHVISAPKYMKNLSQDQSYLKGNTDEPIVRRKKPENPLGAALNFGQVFKS